MEKQIPLSLSVPLHTFLHILHYKKSLIYRPIFCDLFVRRPDEC